MRKKVLIIDNSLHITGALKAITRSSMQLSDEFEFLFVLPSGSYASGWIKSRGFRTLELPFVELSRSPKSILRYVPFLFKNGYKLRDVIRAESVGLVHCNDLYNLTGLSTLLFGSKTPIVTHIRFLPEKFPALLFRFWLSLHFKFSKHIISVSQFLANQIPPHKDLSVIYDRLPDENIPNFPTVGKNRNQTLLYLSNVIPGKGHDYAVEVFSRLLPDFPEWRLKFVGGDMGLLKNQVYKESLRQRCRELSIESNTIWCDFVDDVAREYETAEIALNFSESESFSLTTAEALFFGCPIVATACGGPSEIVDHDKTGFLVPAGNVAAMVSSLRVLMNDAQLRKRFSEEAQKSVRRKFATENTSDKLRQVYKTVLSGSPSEKND